MTGAEVRAWRMRFGLTLEQATEILLVGPRAVDHWEHGRRVPDERSVRLMRYFELYGPVWPDEELLRAFIAGRYAGERAA
jgi:DNA-binding transcriptional regulator YiaG